MAREYDNIADAISAVKGEVGEQSTKIAGILEALEGKAGGGLPSSISKIDGGSFTVASDTVCNTYRIGHNLGVIPKGVYVWCDSFTENTTYTADRLISWFMGFLSYTNDGTSYSTGEYMQFHRTAGGTAYVDSSYFNYPWSDLPQHPILRL